jgi:hypothetical protein
MKDARARKAHGWTHLQNRRSVQTSANLATEHRRTEPADPSEWSDPEFGELRKLCADFFYRILVLRSYTREDLPAS